MSITLNVTYYIAFLSLCGFWTPVVSWRSFNVIQENVKTNITAPDYISEATIYIRKVNRTFEGMNSTCTFSRTINDSLIVRAQSFELRGTKYHPSVLDTKFNLCKFYENPTKVSPILSLFYPTLTRYGNWPTKCPVEAGTYYVYNFNVNAEAFPVYFPENRFRFVITLYHKDIPLFNSVWSFRVEQKHLFQKAPTENPDL